MFDHALRSLRRRFTLALLASLITLATAIPASAQNPDQPQFVPGEVIVKYKPQARAQGQRTINRRGHASLTKSVRLARTYVYRVEGMSVLEAVEALRQDPDVEFAEPNFIYPVIAAPNDPDFGLQWGLRNTGQTGGTAAADIGATRAWDFTTGDTNVVVAVIDAGTDPDHEDLAANMMPGWDFGNNDDDPDNHETNPFRNPDHGTHVAGIIGAVGNNSIGVTGVAWRVKILPLKGQDDGGLPGVELSAAIDAIDYAIAAGARVINNSWGGINYSESLRQALLRADSAGVIVVCGAGNNRNDNDVYPFYPASYDIPSIVSVAASDHNDDIWNEQYFAFGSNWGDTTVDLAAPGADIYSTLADRGQSEIYGSFSGTSMAAPQVSGAFALLLSRYPTLTATQAISRILQYADSATAWAGKTVTARRLNIGRAVMGEDSLPPDAIADFAHAKVSSNWVRLRWTSPQDDGYLQRAVTYNIRRSTSPITALNFAYATPVSDLPTHSAAGALDSVIVDSLSTSTQYYFALTSLDEAGNESLISNVDTVTTLGPPTASETPNPVAATLLTGATSNISFKLKNAGGGGLDYSVANPSVSWAIHNFGAVSPTGTLFAGDSIQWSVHLDALSKSGVNSGSFVITTNDPNRTSITVNLQMTVTSAPDLVVRPGSHDFGAIFVGSTRAKTFQISNPGNQTLSVSSIGTSHADYDASVSSLTISPGDSGAVEVVFAPSSTSTGNATLDLTTNDPDEGTVHINMLGDVLDVSVSPVAVTDTTCAGDRVVNEVSVINSSAVPVVYQVRSAAGSTRALSEENELDDLTGMRVLTHSGYSYSSSYAILVNDLVGRGAEVVDTTGTLTASLLRDFHVFFLPIGYSSMSQSERTAVADWVSDGGTLLLMNASYYVPAHELCTDLSTGIDYAFDSSDNNFRENVENISDHEMTEGVSYLIPGTTLAHLTVSAPAHSLVTVDDNVVIAAYANVGAGRLVAIAGNFFVDEGPTEEIDVAHNRLFANQVVGWLADGVWLAADPMTGTVASSSNANLDVTFDGTHLAAGTYTRDMVVQITSPDTKEFVVPMTLKLGIPDILPPGNISYGNVPQMTSSTKTAKVKNTGTCALEVTAMDLSAYFTWAGPGSSFSPVSIAPGDSFVATIRFTPEYQGMHYGTLTIISNDPDANEDTVTVNLQGKGFGYQYAAASTGAPREVTIRNSGSSDLRWQLTGARTETPPVAGFTLSSASPPVISKRGAGDTDGLRDLSSARIAMTGAASILSRDLVARGATVAQVARPLKDLSGYDALWLTGDPLGSEERSVVSQWVRVGGALLVEGDVSFDAAGSDASVGFPSAQAVSTEGVTGRFGEWLELGTGAVVRVTPEGSSDASMQDRSVRLAANKALDWLIPSDWIAFDTESGLTSPGATTKVGVREGTAALPPGMQQIEVMAYTSNPDQPRVSLAVRLTVSPRDEIARPTIHALRQSAPNPMAAGTRIAFDLPVEERVTLEVFDVNGRSVQTLVDKLMPAGTHNVDWNGQAVNGRRVAAGVYFYRIKTATFHAVKKLVVSQ